MTNNHKLVCARAARDEFAEAYRRGIQDYRRSRLLAAVSSKGLARYLPESLPKQLLGYLHDPGVAGLAWEGSVKLANARASRITDIPFRIMARKRPLQESERYDCLSLEGQNNAVVMHDGRVHRDGRALYMTHSRFCLDRVFGEADDNATIHAEALRPLMRRAQCGGRGTLLLFGQTGTGKTYTARGVLQELASEVFDHGDGGDSRPRSAALLCYELAGTRGGREAVFDLLAERKPVKCLTGEDGHVHIRGATTVQCSNTEELLEAVARAFALRSSETTERNEASSRSHAVVELHLQPPNSSEETREPSGSGGVLRIVDLAGSERNFETQFHTRKMAERGGHINYSLLMLKECARIMNRNRKRLDDDEGAALQHIPFRSSRLTHLLQKCFLDEDHRTVAITTLSPSPTDVEHSLNSLQHIGMMRGARWWEQSARSKTLRQARDGGGAAAAESTSSFSQVVGRGHGLHSKLQDARAGQLKLHAFGMVTGMGGTMMKKWEPENVKTEAFIDPRWHREMDVAVEEEDVWVLREADCEVVQVLTEWREEQWEARCAHDIRRWSPEKVQAFVQSLDLPGARLPSTMTGNQLCRLGRRGLTALCSDVATAEALHEALQGERAMARREEMAQAGRNAKLWALGQHKAHLVPTAAEPTATEPTSDQAASP